MKHPKLIEFWFVAIYPFKKLMKAYIEQLNGTQCVTDEDQIDINKSVVERLININKYVAVVLELELC